MQENVGIIIENDRGELLMQLRDEFVKYFPNRWVLFGGAIEKGETPKQAILREIKEEIGLDLEKVRFLKRYLYNGKIKQYFFYKKLNINLKNIRLNEGKSIAFFCKEDIKKLDLGFNIKEVLENFYNKKGMSLFPISLKS